MTAAQTFRNTLVVVLTLAAAYILFLSARILIVLFISIIIASAIRPSILRLRTWRIPEGIAILLVYGLIGFFVFLLGVIVLPPSVNQLSRYLQNEDILAGRIIYAETWLEQFLEEQTGRDITLPDPEQIRTAVTGFSAQLQEAAPEVAAELGAAAGDFVLVVVMGFYWLTSRDQAVKFLLQLFPLGRRAETDEVILEVENSMGAYVRGIVLVCTFVGVANFAILYVLRVPNAVTLGFIVGLTTALPIIGGYIGAGTAVLLALLSSPLHALFALGSFLAVQQIENHYLTPRVMSRSVGLNPILVIVFLFVGFSLGGVIGALIAVPIAGSIVILVRHLILDPRRVEVTPQTVDGGILLTTSSSMPPPPAAAQESSR